MHQTKDKLPSSIEANSSSQTTHTAHDSSVKPTQYEQDPHAEQGHHAEAITNAEQTHHTEPANELKPTTNLVKAKHKDHEDEQDLVDEQIHVEEHEPAHSTLEVTTPKQTKSKQSAKISFEPKHKRQAEATSPTAKTDKQQDNLSVADKLAAAFAASVQLKQKKRSVASEQCKAHSSLSKDQTLSQASSLGFQHNAMPDEQALPTSQKSQESKVQLAAINTTSQAKTPSYETASLGARQMHDESEVTGIDLSYDKSKRADSVLSHDESEGSGSDLSYDKSKTVSFTQPNITRATQNLEAEQTCGEEQNQSAKAQDNTHDPQPQSDIATEDNFSPKSYFTQANLSHEANSDAPNQTSASNDKASTEKSASKKASSKKVNSEKAASEKKKDLGQEANDAAVYDGALQAEQAAVDSIPQRNHVFLRSLQFRIIWIVTLAGIISMTIMSVLTLHRISKTINDFVDEELTQIASVAINYNMNIPRRWEAPRHNHDRVWRRQRTAQYNFVIQKDENNQMYIVTQEQTQVMQSPANQANSGANKQNAQESGNYGYGYNYAHGFVQANNNNEQINDPALKNLSNSNYDIIIAPLFARPGDALYIPHAVENGFYTLMVANERVRAFVTVNSQGNRFVVARPLKPVNKLMRQSFYASFMQFFMIDLLAIPLIIIVSINFMLRPLNRLAQELYLRSDEDLGPVLTNEGSKDGFIPSELDGFIVSINRLFQRVDESMQSKRRFIADAAHEMRTQSTVLSLQVEALDNEDLSPSAKVKLKRLKEGIAREKSLMTSLLTLAREQGCSDLSLERINIFELYTKLIEEQGLVADRKNIDLGVEGEVNFTLISDRSKLMRIMSNLLSNAIKYTPEDGRIDLKAYQHPDGCLTLTVQDDGPGIPPEDLKHILEPFYRVDGDRSAVQGTGLGLAIVKASCDSLKAQIRFANAKPHGLIASVTLKDMPIPANHTEHSPCGGDKHEQDRNNQNQDKI